MNIKTEGIYNSYKNAKLVALGREKGWSTSSQSALRLQNLLD